MAEKGTGSAAGRQFGLIVKDDVIRLVSTKLDFLGCIEWHIRASGRVEIMAENWRDTTIIASWAQQQRCPCTVDLPDSMVMASEGPSDPLVCKVFVRLEPGVPLGGGRGFVRYVVNINSVDVAEGLRGRGFFSAALDVLEEWIASAAIEEEEGLRWPRALEVQNVVNEDLKRHLDRRGAWLPIDGGRSRVYLG